MRRWWLSEEWRGISFTWDLWYGCNYRCSYCWWEMTDTWASLAKEHLILPPSEWLKCWKRICDRYGTVRVDIIGGEPLHYPKSLELFAGMAEWHAVSITTNLSVSMEYLQRLAAKTSPERVHLAASFHPEFSSWTDFLNKLLFLQEIGYEPFVNMVAWPPHLKEIMEKREALHSRGIPLTTQVFQGSYGGKEYPAAYTDEEREVLNLTIPDPTEVEYRLEQEKTLGKLCGAGHVYGNIKSNGDVYRCGQDSRFSYGKPIGNIFDEDFELLHSPRPCPYPHCSCGEFVYLWENWKGMAAGRGISGEEAKSRPPGVYSV